MDQALNPVDSVRTILARLHAFLEQETQQINSSPNFDFQVSSERKSRLLFELNRASRSLDPTTPDPHLIADLQKLQVVLRENEMRIKAHLNAVREISNYMVGVLKKEEADGTYQEFF